MARAKKKPDTAFDGVLFVRCPRYLPATIECAAERGLMSTAAYVRGAVLRQLREDGFDPKQGAPGQALAQAV